MNEIGKSQTQDILDSFAWDSTGCEETSNVRAWERRDSHIFFFRDWYNIMTREGLKEGRRLRIYEKHFSIKRNLFDEGPGVSLCTKLRVRILNWDLTLAICELEKFSNKNIDAQGIERIKYLWWKIIKCTQLAKKFYYETPEYREQIEPYLELSNKAKTVLEKYGILEMGIEFKTLEDTDNCQL